MYMALECHTSGIGGKNVKCSIALKIPKYINLLALKADDEIAV